MRRGRRGQQDHRVVDGAIGGLRGEVVTFTHLSLFGVVFSLFFGFV